MVYNVGEITQGNTMKLTHKLLLGTLMMTGSLFAEVTTLLPYAASLQYDSSPSKSTKDNGKMAGLYFSYGNLDYLFEMDYAKTNIKYKNATTSNLVQDDFTVAYSFYSDTHFLKLGLHHISTTDTDLGNGNTFILTFGENRWDGYDKYSYALETYYSVFKDGFNDRNISKKIALLQITPSFTFSKSIDINTRNTLHIAGNWVHTNDYTKNNYYSYEVQDTLYYKNFFVNAKFYGGQMITGVKDGGNTVFNTKDVLNSGYGVKLGYYFTPSSILAIGYEVNKYREFLSTADGSYSVALLTYTYSF